MPSSIEIILELINKFLGIFILAGLGLFFAYFKKKGENLATKEDIKKITREVESIKHEYSANLESLKASIGSQLYIHQIRY